MQNLENQKPSDNAWIGKMLLGAFCNIALQASQKKLTKENFIATSMVGASAGLAEHLVSKNVTQGKEFSNGLAAGSSAGSMLLLGNSIINGKADFRSGLATMGTLAVLDGTMKKIFSDTIVEEYGNYYAENNEYPPIVYSPKKIHPILKNHGILKLHKIYESYINNEGNSSYILKDYVNEFDSDTLNKALVLAMKTPTFRNILHLFDNKKHTLVIAYNDISDNGRCGKAWIYLLDNRNGATISAETKRGIFDKIAKKQNSDFSLLVEIELYPKSITNLPYTNQIAELAVILGHELFIHNFGIESVALWQRGYIYEALDLASDYRGEGGIKDHAEYAKGKKPMMKQYLNELLKVSSNRYFGVTSKMIETAIKNHDKMYEKLKFAKI